MLLCETHMGRRVCIFFYKLNTCSTLASTQLDGNCAGIARKDRKVSMSTSDFGNFNWNHTKNMCQIPPHQAAQFFSVKIFHLEKFDR